MGLEPSLTGELKESDSSDGQAVEVVQVVVRVAVRVLLILVELLNSGVPVAGKS